MCWLRILCIAFFLAPAIEGMSQVSGRLVSGGEPVFPGFIRWSADKGIAVGSDGTFTLTEQLPDSVIVQALGFVSKTVAVPDEGYLEIELEPRWDMLQEAVVTGTLAPVSLMQSPIRVEVLSGEMLNRFPARSVSESLHFMNGIQETYNCGICGTNDIHLNGMEGPYTLILIDGMPVMSALASVYSMNAIPDALVDRIEVIRGPSSAVYGSEAMGGVINIRTRRAQGGRKWFAEAEGTTHGQQDFTLGGSRRWNERSGVLFAANASRNTLIVDENGDGFTDIPLVQRYGGLIKWDRTGRVTWSAALRPYIEDRWGGQNAWTPEWRGEPGIYGESIRTRRVEATGSAHFPKQWLLEASAVYHYQDSYYGLMHYLADQQTGFIHLSRAVQQGNHFFRFGNTHRLSRYRDNSPLFIDERRWIPGVYLQDEWNLPGHWSALIGFRVDSHREHGFVAAPQLNIRYANDKGFTWRLNSGKGFRYVSLFAEDHAALTGSRTVVIEEQLQPEESYTVSSDVSGVFHVGERGVAGCSANGFASRFGNKILPDYDTDPDLLVYRNMDGVGFVKGVNVDAYYSYSSRFRISAGVTWHEVYEREAMVARTWQLFTPRWSSMAALYWKITKRLDITWNMKWIGVMPLPEVEDVISRPLQSEPFALHHAQLRYQSARGLELWVALRNVFDYTQPAPLIGAEDPFAEAFDASYIYGPLQGRNGVIGVRYHFSGS